jgi:hypothetical protein
MNTLYQLEKLRNNERCKEAKQELKEFKAKYYPHLLQQPKFNLPKMSHTPMSEWTEKFEEYGDY